MSIDPVMQSMMDDPTSCEGCKFLYADGEGHSDYTWMDTWIRCALDKNAYLKEHGFQEPLDWKEESNLLKRIAIFNNQQCDRYERGEFIQVSPDGNLCSYDSNGIHDDEQLLAIAEHRGYDKETVEKYWKAGKER